MRFSEESPRLVVAVLTTSVAPSARAAEVVSSGCVTRNASAAVRPAPSTRAGAREVARGRVSVEIDAAERREHARVVALDAPAGVLGRAQVVGERRAQGVTHLGRVELHADHVLVGRRREHRREPPHGPLAGRLPAARERDGRRQQLGDAVLGALRRRSRDRGRSRHRAQRDLGAVGERGLRDRAQRLGAIEADARLGRDRDGRAARLEHEARVDGRLRDRGELGRERQVVRVAQHRIDRAREPDREQQAAAQLAGVERRGRGARRIHAHAEVVRRERRAATGDRHGHLALQLIADRRRDLALGIGARCPAERDARDAHAVCHGAALQQQVPERDRDQRRDHAEAEQHPPPACARTALTAIQPHRRRVLVALSTLKSALPRVRLPRAPPPHAAKSGAPAPTECTACRNSLPPASATGAAVRYGDGQPAAVGRRARARSGLRCAACAVRARGPGHARRATRARRAGHCRRARPRAAPARARRARVVAAPGAQRDGRRPAHQPRPGAAGRGRARTRAGGRRRLLEPRARPRHGRPRIAPGSRRRASSAS